MKPFSSIFRSSFPPVKSFSFLRCIVFFSTLAASAFSQTTPLANSATFTCDENGYISGNLTPTQTSVKFRVTTQPTHGAFDYFFDLTGAFAYKPAKGYSGTDSFIFEAFDSSTPPNVSAPATVTITIRPIPHAKSDAFIVDEGKELNGFISATCKNANTLSFTLASEPYIAGYVSLVGSPSAITDTTTGITTTTIGFLYEPYSSRFPNRWFGTTGFAFTVSDGTVTSESGTITINVKQVNHIPSADGQDVSVDEDKVLTGILKASDADNERMGYRIVAQPTHGSISLDTALGEFTYRPNRDKSTSDSFTFVAYDAFDVSAPATISISINTLNEAPVAKWGTLDTDEDVALTGKLSASDVDHDPLTYRTATAPRCGKVTIPDKNKNDFTYIPSKDFNGWDSFGFIVNDGKLDSTEAMVYIRVKAVNDSPTAQSLIFTLSPGKSLTEQMHGFDIDGDTLIYTKTSGPSQGTVTILGDGRFTYAPLAPDFKGDVTFAYAVSDGLATSSSQTVTLKVGNDAKGFIGDTLIPRLTNADFPSGPSTPVFSQVQIPAGFFASATALDQAVDRINGRLYVLTTDGLKIYNLDPSASPATPTYFKSVDIVGTRLALSIDGRTAYVGGAGKVTAINLYPEGVFKAAGKLLGFTTSDAQSVMEDAFKYRREFPFPMFLRDRAVAAMGVHPAGGRLFIVLDMKASDKKLNINNDLLRSDVGNGQSADAVALPSDFGFITSLDISAAVQSGEPKGAPSEFEYASTASIKNLIYSKSKVVAIGIKNIAFSPDGNCAFLTAVGAQAPRATAFGIMPTSDEGTGGIVVLDVRPHVNGKPNVAYLGFIPTTEKEEKTAELRRQIVTEGWKIVHPDVQAAFQQFLTAGGQLGVAMNGSGFVSDQTLTALQGFTVAATVLAELESSYKDYGYMEAYSKLYPHDMVGASSVAISHTGDFGVLTLQDTNNLGLLSLAPSDTIEGYAATNLPDFFIRTGTGKSINKLQSEGTFASWAYPQKVVFTSDDSRIFISMAGGTPKADLTNKFGSADAFMLRSERDRPKPNTNTAPGYSLYSGGAHKSPRLAATLQSFGSDHDLLSDQLKSYNRWNGLRVVSNDPDGKKRAKLVSTDALHLTIPGKPMPVNGNTPDSLEVGYLLPPSGVGYRLNTFGLPIDTTNFATKSVANAIEQLGLEWDKRYREYLRTNVVDAKYPIKRPYFVVGLLSQPGGGVINNQNQEAVKYMPGSGSEVDFPYFKEDSDDAFDFVKSNGRTKPIDNTGETKKGFDKLSTKALLQLLLDQPRLKSIDLDPILLDIFPEFKDDPRLVPHGISGHKNNNSRRDMDNHMFVSFSRMSVNLAIDSDNNGVLDQTPAEDSLKNIQNKNGTGGTFIPPNIGDQDSDGVPDYADGYDRFPLFDTSGASAKFTPMVIRFPDELDLTKTEFRLTYSESDPAAVTRSSTPPYQYILPSTGALRVWTKDGDVSRKMGKINNLSGGDYIASGIWFSVADLKLGSARECTVYIESVRPGVLPVGASVLIEMQAKSGEPIIPVSLKDTVLISSASGSLVVDTNLDGQIKLASENDSDTNSRDKPLYFWINDDHDTATTIADLEKPGDAMDGVVNGQSDLKDFFPVFLDLKQTLTTLPPSASVKYKLKQGDGCLNFVYSNLTLATAFAFRTPGLTSGFGPAFSQSPGVATVQQITADGIELSQTFLMRIRDQNQGVILLEGRRPSTEPLRLVVERNGEKLIEYPLYLGWVEFVEDSNRNKIIESNDKGVKRTRFGLWDKAYTDRQLGDIVANKDFIGDDARCVYIRITDSCKNTNHSLPDSFKIEWYTSKPDKTDNDRPALRENLALTETLADSGVFVSRALMLVTGGDYKSNGGWVDHVDVEQATFDGANNTIPRGQLNHALREVDLEGYVNIQDPAAPLSAQPQLRVPLFAGPELSELKIKVFNFNDPVRGGSYVDQDYIDDQLKGAQLRWASLGVKIVQDGATINLNVPAGVLTGPPPDLEYDAQKDPYASDKALFNVLKSYSADETLSVYFLPHNDANAITASRKMTQDSIGTGKRCFIGISPTVNIKNVTLSHELFHALFNKGDDFESTQWRPYLTFNTHGADSFGLPLPDVRVRRRMHIESILPVEFLHNPYPSPKFLEIQLVPLFEANDSIGSPVLRPYTP